MRQAGLRAAVGLAALWLAGCAQPPAQAPAQPPAARHLVAAAHPLAAEAGRRILRAGGSAVDAGIAVQLVLTLVEPQSSGIGGGLFLVHHDGRRVQTYDGRETAPAAATPQLFLKEDGRPMAHMEGAVGGRSVGVPGTLRALELAHRQHGRLPWKALFQPAIELAEQGFAVSPRLATLLAEPGIAGTLRRDADAAALFYDAAGEPRRAGHRLRNPALAATLREVAERGAVAMHEGPIAHDIVAKVRGHAANPGGLSTADLSGYRAKERDPLCFDHRTWRICGMAPPSSGTLVLAQVLGMLARHDLAALRPRAGQLDPQAVHWLTEAQRLAYADRDRYVADPDVVPLPGGDARALLDAGYLSRRAALIGPSSMGRAQPGQPLAGTVALADDGSPELPATSHVSISDGHGNLLSMTMTIEHLFGSRLMVRGFMLNNELTDFSFVPDRDGVPVANRMEGGKRPRSSMTPLLVFDRASGRAVMSVGSPGGSFIPGYVGKALVGTLDWGLPLQAAMALPNFISRNGPTELEDRPDVQTLAEALRARGHEVRLLRTLSGLNGVQRVEGGWAGGTDPRGEGAVLGD